MNRTGPSAGLRPAFAWPVPTALGLITGIALAGNGVPAATLLLLPLGLPGLALLLLRPRPGEPDRAPAQWAVVAGTLPLPRLSLRELDRRALIALLSPPVALLVGFLLMSMWLAQPNPTDGWRDRPLQLSGFSDGDTFLVREPLTARLSISPRGSLPRGEASITGTIEEGGGKRNPGGFDYGAYLRRQGVHGVVRVDEVNQMAPARGISEHLAAGLGRGLSEESAALVEAMTLGRRDELGELRDVFSRAGLAHVLALSGLHIGLLVGFAHALFSRLGSWRYPATILLTVGYALVVPTTPSVLRATSMVIVVLLGLWAGTGRVNVWQTLALAAMLTLLLRPAYLFDLSFQLSYAAVAGILLYGLPLLNRLEFGGTVPARLGNFVAASLITSSSAQLLTLPLIAHSFGTVPLLSPLVNLVGVPLVSLLVPAGFMGALLGLLPLDLPSPVAPLLEGLASLLILVARAGAQLPQLPWGEIEPVGYLYFAVAAGALALLLSGRLRPRRALLLIAMAGALSSVTPPKHDAPELIALDVGQGDSFLLRLPGRIEVLVDGGGSPFSDFDVGAQTVVPALHALGIDELELVIATHADADHMEGLASVLQLVPTQLLVYGANESGKEVYDNLMEAARAGGVETVAVSRGQRIEIGGATLEILNPPPEHYGASNDDSVAMLVDVHGHARLLLLGDISRRVEERLTIPQVDILAAPHHGSNSSTSERLLAQARPSHVVISVGRNNYGHPHPAVLSRIEDVRARIHTTIEGGAVRFPLRNLRRDAVDFGTTAGSVLF